MSTLTAKLKKTWAIIRELSGDDAYERYLAHLAQAHSD
ncbi:MAG: CstA-like transporter-associated (seleno)protein [Thiotrichaceae bacterium]|nr:CstA-like transporter-associated (seleno)protein [Thiotrichaceae bacterium]